MKLKGKAPKANTLEEAKEIIKALWAVIQKLSERLETNSKNSSLAPSKDRSSKINPTLSAMKNAEKIPRSQVVKSGIRNMREHYFYWIK